MKKTGIEMMMEVNIKLENHGQVTRIVNWTGKEITLSNGRILSGRERNRFLDRIVRAKKTSLWIYNLDNLENGQISEKQIKSKLAAEGGKKVQNMHGEKLHKNLNNGNPWTKGKKLNGYITKSGKEYHVWNKGLNKDNNEILRNLSESRMGENNPVYGKSISESARELKSSIMKKKILEGSFTPKTSNRLTHWNSYYDGSLYRSSWEALYQYHNPDDEYEKLRIYYNSEESFKIYIVDFVNHSNKTVTEIKPRNLTKTEKFKLQWNALCEWANQYGYKTQLVDQEWFYNFPLPTDFSKFDENTVRKIKYLYDKINKKNRN